MCHFQEEENSGGRVSYKMDEPFGKDLYLVSVHFSILVKYLVLVVFKWSIIFSQLSLPQITDFHFYSPFGLL